jgi:parallel beta-helix repeat protein
MKLVELQKCWFMNSVILSHLKYLPSLGCYLLAIALLAPSLAEFKTAKINEYMAVAENRKNIYYVDVNQGSDTNSGHTEKLAFKTINKANEIVNFGDTVYVKNGIYNENITLKKSGDSNNWINFKAFPGQKPVIRGNQDGTFKVEGNYIKIIGFNITSTEDGSGIHVGKGNHHTQILKNEIHDSGCGGVSGQETDYLHIEGNIIYRNAFRSPYLCSGISIYQAKASDNKPGFHNIIRSNISYSNENRRVKVDGTVTDGNGIIIDDFRHTQGQNPSPKYTAYTLVENNIVFDNGGRGIHVFQSDNVVVRNNTAFKNLKSNNLYGEFNGEFTALFSSNIGFYNNIAYAANKTKKTFVDDYSERNTWDYNLSYNGTILFGKVKSSSILGKYNLIDVPPLFMNPSIVASQANFRLQSQSPAINSGTSISAAQVDFAGNRRPLDNKYDLGAYEFNCATASKIDRGKCNRLR